jgi:hypothetical protein
VTKVLPRGYSDDIGDMIDEVVAVIIISIFAGAALHNGWLDRKTIHGCGHPTSVGRRVVLDYITWIEGGVIRWEKHFRTIWPIP